MRVGLLSDTHVPYRAPEIPARVIRALEGCDVILHAGDVDEPWALAPLETLAPVHAVRGNYHLLDRSAGGASFPETVELDLSGFRVAVHHGFSQQALMWLWRVRTAVRNLFGRWDYPAYDAAMARSLLKRFPRADVIVFGHTHRYYAAWWGRTLVVNPGAAMRTAYFDTPLIPSVAHLSLEPGQAPRVERIPLPEDGSR